MSIKQTNGVYNSIGCNCDSCTDVIALIDADIIVYRVGFTTNDVDERIALWRADEMLDGILKAAVPEEYICYFSDSKNNFRLDLFPEYKGNRKQPKPRHLEALTNHILQTYNTEVAWGQEADDALGIEQCRQTNSVICSIDKDLKQIPGSHWNFVKKEHDFVTPLQGLRTFYNQLLTGDTTDNIRGCKGIGATLAKRALADCVTEIDFFTKVSECYESKNGENWKEDLLLAGQLLKIRTYPGEIWNFPSET